MFNPLPLLALGVVALGYSVSTDQTEQYFETLEDQTIVAFPATPDLSVRDFVASVPQSITDAYCDTHAKVTESLSLDFAEVRQEAWTEEMGLKKELWASDLMGTWTVLHVDADAVACIIRSGHGWTEGMTVADVLSVPPVSS